MNLAKALKSMFSCLWRFRCKELAWMDQEVIKHHVTCFFYIVLLFSCNQSNPVEKYVQIEDVRIHCKTLGRGRITVIFENGMASPKEVWNHIPDSISKTARILSYDRAGIGKSESSSRKRTIPNMVLEIRELLQKENIKPPYIYVAHSMGSYIARYFAINYPDEIKALLLIDPSPDRLYDDYSEAEYEEFKNSGNDSFEKATAGERREWEHYLDNRKYVQEKGIPDHIPMYVISASQWNFDRYHREMLNDHPLSRQIKVDTGHDVHKEKPRLVINLIRALIGQ